MSNAARRWRACSTAGLPRTVHMVETDDRSIAEIAAEIIGFAGWLPRT
jgi:hypothetical protein